MNRRVKDGDGSQVALGNDDGWHVMWVDKRYTKFKLGNRFQKVAWVLPNQRPTFGGTRPSEELHHRHRRIMYIVSVVLAIFV